MGKLLEEMILQRLKGHMVGENGLSESQFGFRNGRSTVDAIQAVVDIATKARRGTGKRKGFGALVSIDIRNAFNTTRWNICIEAMVRKKVPDYLLRMIDDYLSDRWVIYEGDKWSLKEEMTCGAPQGSQVGPLVWNVMYDDFLRMDVMILFTKVQIGLVIEGIEKEMESNSFTYKKALRRLSLGSQAFLEISKNNCVEG